MNTTDAMTDQTASAGVPAEDLRELGERLVGTWQVSGGAEGRVRFEWAAGGAFLVQHVELEQYGQQATGFEVIGHLAPFGGEPSADIHSRYYGSGGETFDYVYALDGDRLTIWAGEVGSPAYYEGTLSADGDRLTGAWVYPGGGGYESTSVRIA